MITSASEWVYNETLHGELQKRDRNKNKQESQIYQRRHVLFPPIVAGQFIPGSKEYIPLHHDGIVIGQLQMFTETLQ
ncbi:hypothetical protein HG535_0A03240 [Zygotorulaspora mrakii]|uniref:Uncharacterized protein n=1 Tax=Zygotorulaspora mrakii TaxID=42260 RepID=A0A7H9AVR1_ZYGMR|nr:uncharacterized protein HG535_0A03240 [Zygotorulaspora mrakii]QLG70385.1 hypothetical protein HG535_0A03240 [Zygotorulaspora mrakii]